MHSPRLRGSAGLEALGVSNQSVVPGLLSDDALHLAQAEGAVRAHGGLDALVSEEFLDELCGVPRALEVPRDAGKTACLEEIEQVGLIEDELITPVPCQ